MKICYILNQFPELSQTFVLRQIVDLHERGHEVDVIAARVGTEAAHHAALCRTANRYGLDHRTRYTAMPESLIERALRGGWRAIPAIFQHPRIALTALDVRRFGWFAATGSLLAMGLPLANEHRKYDAIIAHFGPQGMLAQGLREMGILEGPLVTFFHAYDLTSAPRLGGRAMYSRLFERGELQLAISERGRAQLRILGAPPANVRVHHMGINVATFYPPSQPRRLEPTDNRRIISIGRLVPKKGFDHGLQAVAKATSRGFRLEYEIYGSGPMAKELDRSIDALGLRGKARLCGPASQDGLAKILRASDTLLVPSITSRAGDEEGIPMVLMEALATELPVVASDCGAVSELVAHEQCGLLVREGDSDALSDALCRLQQGPELGYRLGRLGRQRVLADFNEAKLGRQLVELLADLSNRDATRKTGNPGALTPRHLDPGMLVERPGSAENGLDPDQLR